MKIMNKIICFIKAIICCIFPKQTKYYKHSKKLVDINPELFILGDKDDEFIVNNKVTSKEIDEAISKMIKESR